MAAHRSRSLVWVRFAAFAALGSPALADTIVVDDDGGPGVDFTDIQPAVLAASNGDTVLVYDGTYGPFVVDAKSVTVRAAGTNVLVTGTVRLRNSGPDTVMRLLGLDVDSDEKALVVQSNQGPTSVTDCELRGGHGDNEVFPGDTYDGFDAVELLDSAAVLLLRTSARGGTGASVIEETAQTVPTNGGRGLRLAGSVLFAFECEFEGGYGGSAYDTICDDGGDAGDGLSMSGGYLWAEDCHFRGRDGGFADCCCFFTCCGDGGRGGDGLRLESGAPLAEHAGCLYFGGVGGGVLGPDATPGADGLPIRVLSGSAAEVPALALPVCFGDGSGLACPCSNPGAAGEGCANSTGAGAVLSATGTTSAVIDDLQLYVAQAAPSQTCVFIQGTTLVALPFRDGILCGGAPIVRLEITALDAAGAASSSVAIGARGGVAPGDTRTYQLWYRDPSGPCGSGSNLSHALVATWH